MLPRLSSQRHAASRLLLNTRDVCLKAAKSQRPVDPLKASAVLQNLVSTSSPSILWSSPETGNGAPRRQLSTADSSTDTAFTRDQRFNVADSSNSRLRIAVDVDEVLGRFVHTLNEFYLDRYGTKYDIKDYWVYEYAKIWKCSQEESNHVVHEFFKSPHFSEGIPVIPGAFDALTRLSATSDLVVVTSRQHIIQDITLEWIDKHYPGLFQEVYFGNHFALEGVSKKKSEICRSIGAEVLIDDNPGYAMDCAQAGINVLLYDWDLGYPWSKMPEGKNHPLIQVVRNWDEVELAIEVLAPKNANMNQLG